MDIISKVLYKMFGDTPYCAHGTTAWDGVCKDCCNDAWDDGDDEIDMGGEPLPLAPVYEISDFQ